MLQACKGPGAEHRRLWRQQTELGLREHTEAWQHDRCQRETVLLQLRRKSKGAESRAALETSGLWHISALWEGEREMEKDKVRSECHALFCCVPGQSYSGKKGMWSGGWRAQRDEESYVSYIEHVAQNDPNSLSQEHLIYLGSLRGATGIWRGRSGKNNVSRVRSALPAVSRSV